MGTESMFYANYELPRKYGQEAINLIEVINIFFRKKIIDRKFPNDNTIIIQLYALLTYKE